MFLDKVEEVLIDMGLAVLLHLLFLLRLLCLMADSVVFLAEIVHFKLCLSFSIHFSILLRL